MISTIQLKRDKVWTDLQRENTDGVAALQEILKSIKTAQLEAMQHIQSKEEIVQGIVADVEKRNVWTWESARKVEEELRKSSESIHVFKLDLSQKVTELTRKSEAAILSINAEKARIMEDFKEEVHQVKSAVTSLIKKHEQDLAAQADRMLRAAVDSNKQYYFDNELDRRTAAERKKLEILNVTVSSSLQDVSSRINQLMIEIESYPKDFEELWSSFDKASGDSSTTMKSELEKARLELDSFKSGVQVFKVEASQVSEDINKLLDSMRVVIEHIELEPLKLLDQIRELEVKYSDLGIHTLAKALEDSDVEDSANSTAVNGCIVLGETDTRGLMSRLWHYLTGKE
jgi:hypothetical protein